jgi:putative membrane protein
MSRSGEAMMLYKVAHLIHLVGFAAYIGAGFAQQQLLKSSSRPSVATAVRDAYERLTATILTKIELPAVLAQVLSGIVYIVLNPGWMKMGWLHGKLLAVLILLVLSHIEMFNARAIVRLRAARGDQASTEIDARKKRHALLGAFGTLAVLAVIGLVVFGR